MTTPLLVFDFDGVLIDGMPEYWWSARAAALSLDAQIQLPEQAPAGFARLRPLIHKGWEMVLMAAELSGDGGDGERLVADYEGSLAQALDRRGWSPDTLQAALERVRAETIAAAPETWLARHRFYPGVVERLRRLPAEGADWLVLTTKGGAFAARILAAAGLEPRAVFGHEQGSKAEVLQRLLQQERGGRPLWFLEDRRPTLERVCADPALRAVRCFLVSWGYLGPADLCDLPLRIQRLDPGMFAAPLAQWP
ncbi:MAG: HAD family hydrolase [Synechococcaceae cyanobacterium]|nr:HAD family hydrolase [Synechococcaceae cyanobacterium]